MLSILAGDDVVGCALCLFFVFFTMKCRYPNAQITNTGTAYEFNANYEKEVDEFHHHVENVPYATILYHPSFLPLFHNSHHVFC